MKQPRTTAPAALAVFVLITISAVSVDVDAQAQRSLTEMYKKEYALLEAEKNALVKRRDAVRATSTRELQRRRGAVEGLGQQLLTTREAIGQLELELARPDADGDDAEAVSAAIGETFTRARASLGAGNVPVEAKPADLDAVFVAAARSIKAAGATRSEAGRFFLEDGTQVDGELIHIGHVATYGVSPRGSGALAPAGAGALRLWASEDGATTALDLEAGRQPGHLALFLHEGLEKSVEVPKEKRVADVLEAGGVIGYVIVALGLLALLLILVRALTLLLAHTPTERLHAAIDPLVARGELTQAAAVCARTRGAGARVAEATLGALSGTDQELEHNVAAAIHLQTPRLLRFGTALTVFAAVAPLLGLLGTVTGMISTFDLITEYGTGDPKMLSGGISEALITTELGLIVAIPTLLIGSALSSRAEGVIAAMEGTALRILAATVATPEAPVRPVEVDKEASVERTSGALNGRAERSHAGVPFTGQAGA